MTKTKILSTGIKQPVHTRTHTNNRNNVHKLQTETSPCGLFAHEARLQKHRAMSLPNRTSNMPLPNLPLRPSRLFFSSFDRVGDAEVNGPGK